MISVPKLKDSPNDIKALSNYLVRTNGYELSKLHTPCYKAVMIKYFSDLKVLTGIQKQDFDNFFNTMVDPEYRNVFKVLKNDITSIIIMGIIYYSRHKHKDLAESLYILLAIRFYTNSFSKHWKMYCKEDVWDLAFTNLSQKHLFKLKNGISNTLFYLASEEYKLRQNRFSSTTITEKEILKYVYILRHRISQSVRSFANRYYDIEQNENTLNLNKQKEIDNTTDIVNINLLSNNISERICTYAQVDQKVLLESIKNSSLRRDISISIINELSNIRFKENIRFIIILISKIINLKEICTRQPYLVKQILLDKKRIGSYSIKDEIYKLTETMNTTGIKSVNKDQIISLIANYITLYIKTKVC